MSLLVALSGPVLDKQPLPTALIAADPPFCVVGSVVKLDGTASVSASDSELTYEWKFVKVPIGSSVAIEGFKDLDESGGVVSFSPDIVGEYLISLTVSNGVYTSETVETQVSTRSILVPHGRNIVPDGKFIWSYIRDVWAQVEDREWFETLWSALIQIVGAELLSTYQVDFNKSIRDIQDLYQRRWLSYEPKLPLVTDDCTFYIGNHCAGITGTSTDLGNVGQCIILPSGELIVTTGSVLHGMSGYPLEVLYDSRQADNVSTYDIINNNGGLTGYLVKTKANPVDLSPATIPDHVNGRIVQDAFPTFSFQSVEWDFGGSGMMHYALWMSETPSPIDFLPPMIHVAAAASLSDVLVGDVIHAKSGVNAGFYKIVDINGSIVTVHKKPPSSSAGLMAVDIYRPVGFKIDLGDVQVTDTFAVPYEPSTINPSTLVPGRIVIFGGMAYTIIRTVIDNNQDPPLIFFVTDYDGVLTDLTGVSWRAPHTLVSKSQDFEALGVSSGDRIVVDVYDEITGNTAPAICQVIGVSKNRVGVILTDEFPEQGMVPEVSEGIYRSLADTFGITSVLKDTLGNIVLSGEAKALSDYINSGRFRTEYWNRELSPSDTITVNGRGFKLLPRYIIRNRFVPVSDELRSVPRLQNWIVQPEATTTRDGVNYQIKNGKEYEIESLPRDLAENIDYTIDGQTAFYGDLTFLSGTNIIETEAGHFLDRNLRPNDIFTIVTPSVLAGDYRIVSVLDNNHLLLKSAVPRYIISEEVTARVRMTRRSGGSFLRFVPGGFSAKDPAPPRFWAEVSLFDNNKNIENNFGLLVGLTIDDVNRISEPVNYRQAVAGLMYAFSHGSSEGRMRLGAQILLGLPFAEHRGIIRSIEKDYRLNGAGTPVLGRLLIEDVDPNGVTSGLYRVYTYPIDEASYLSGIEINPATGQEYAVGDTVELFSPLCKGVEVTDYLSEDASSFTGAAFLQKYNAVRVRANNNVFSSDELDLLSSFMKKITPSYIGFIVSSLLEVVDDAGPLEAENHRLRVHPVENASFGLHPAIMYDGKSSWAPYMYWDDGMYWVRKHGRDLVTTFNGTTPSFDGVIPGGFVTPSFGEGPVCKDTDRLVILDGPNQGSYDLSSLTDTTVTAIGSQPKGFLSATQGYMILRKVSSEIRSGTGSYNSTNIVTLGAGLVADGVTPGDTLIIEDPTSTFYYRRTILRVGGTSLPDGYSPALSAGEVQVDVAIPSTSTSKSYSIYRLPLNAVSDLSMTSVVSPVLPAGDNNVTLANLKMWALLDSGDQLVDTAAPYKVYTVFDPFKAYVSPAIPAGGITATLKKKGAKDSAVPYDQLDVDPYNPMDITWKESDSAAAICASGSNSVQLQTRLGVDPYTPYAASTYLRPGDYLVLLNGANSTVDNGAGPGVYPIIGTSGSNALVSYQLTSNDPSAWQIIRRR